MCGRYMTPAERAYEREWSLRGPHFPPLFPDAMYNIAPGTSVPAVRRTAAGEHELVALRWGLVPFFAKGQPGKYATFNARAETLETTASFRGPWRRAQRCVLPAGGFYEWHVMEDERKQPYFIRTTDQAVFGLAGLWDRSEAPDGHVVESCTIITLPANPLLAEIHNSKQRMPAILAAADRDLWLDGSADEAQATLRPYPEERMTAYRVSTRVNSPRNQDPSVMDPVDDPSQSE
jgi:putative SOS response-associated peptidase YedK